MKLATSRCTSRGHRGRGQLKATLFLDLSVRGSDMAFWRRFLRDSEAATAVEYAVMLALVLIGIMSAIGAVGGQAGGWWGGIKNNLTSAGFGAS